MLTLKLALEGEAATAGRNKGPSERSSAHMERSTLLSPPSS